MGFNTLPVMIQSKSLGERLLILRFLYSGGPSQKMSSTVALVWPSHSTSHFNLQSQLNEFPLRSLKEKPQLHLQYVGPVTIHA